MAIMDEVRRAARGDRELERERQAAQARDIAAGAPTSAVLGDRAAPSGSLTRAGGLGRHPKAFAVLVLAIVLGVFLGAFMTKRKL